MKLAAILLLSVLLVALHQVSANHHSQLPQLAGAKHDTGKKASEHKHLEESGKKSVHDIEKARKGETLRELHKKDDEEGGGKKKVYHDSGSHKSSKKFAGGSEHGAKFQEGAKQKKSYYKKGFREKYHKDEHKKHDSFYSNGHKSGDFEVFGKKNAKFNNDHFSKKHHDSHKSLKDEDDYRKMWLKAGGHKNEEQSGHKDEKASKSHHNHQEKWGKKGAKKGGKQYKYKVPPHKK